MIRISFRLGAPIHTTEFLIESGAISELSALLPNELRKTNAVILTDSNVGPLYADAVQLPLCESGMDVSVFTFSAGEQAKSIQTVSAIYTFLGERKLGRDGLVIALGGGVVGDLAGFVAGTWMRGVPWVYCPTSMEADVDACLGGKTAVNLAAGKNLVGVFHHPMIVAVDPMCLGTLPQRDVRAGLAEAVKHALLQSTQEMEWLETNAAQILALDSEAGTELIGRNLRFKGRIVSEDPYERLNQRVMLNFGHTIGHAIEACAEGALRHGECVSLGMLAAMQVSLRLRLHDSELVDRLRGLLKQFELPTQLSVPLSRDEVLHCILLDKKTAGGKVRLVLLNGIGQPVIRDNITPNLLAEAFDSLR